MQSQNLKYSRAVVYTAIDSERNYQESLVRNDSTDQRPLEQLALIRHILTEIDADWYMNPGPVDMGKIRKIAGIAVRCMEQHGAPAR